MSVQPFIPWLLAAFIPAVIGQVIGARLGSPWISGSAALFLPIMSTTVALQVNQPYWTAVRSAGTSDIVAEAARRNARILAWTWGAGAISMLAVYKLSGLRWQHGWQYGTGMALVALLPFGYSLAVGRSGSKLRQPWLLDLASLMVAVQGIAAIAGVMMLVISGKVASVKPDWAANVIFVAGGLTITILSAIAVRTHACLSPDDRDGPRESS